jgi:hypothetical protein
MPPTFARSAHGPEGHAPQGRRAPRSESCPHVEWLIADRRKREADQNAKRNKVRIEKERREAEAASLQAAQLEMVKEQIEERKARKREKKAPTE